MILLSYNDKLLLFGIFKDSFFCSQEKYEPFPSVSVTTKYKHHSSPQQVEEEEEEEEGDVDDLSELSIDTDDEDNNSRAAPDDESRLNMCS